MKKNLEVLAWVVIFSDGDCCLQLYRTREDARKESYMRWSADSKIVRVKITEVK